MKMRSDKSPDFHRKPQSPQNKTGQVYIQPGEAYITSERIRLVTVLGSCVGTVMYSQSHGMGGLSHAMYPYYPTESGRPPLPETFYVDRALPMMLKRFIERGIPLKQIQTFVFGGSPVIHNMDGCSDERKGIGHANYQAALETLAKLGLKNVWCEPACAHGHRLVLDLIEYRIRLDNLTIA